MAFEFRELTEAETKDLVDKGQRIMALGVARSNIQTERAVAQSERYAKIDNIRAEITKNTTAANEIRSATIAGKDITFRALTDAETKQIVDLDQRNKTLNAEISKIQAELTLLETGWRDRENTISVEVTKYSDDISRIREATEK